MRLEELAALCREAARGLAERGERPLPAAVVVPRPEASRIVALEGFPDDDQGRMAALTRFADDELRPANAPCYGFIGEALLHAPDGPADVVLVAYGARGQGAWVTAAPLEGEQLGEFLPDEPLDPEALPFLGPLQAAVDAAGPPDVTTVH